MKIKTRFLGLFFVLFFFLISINAQHSNETYEGFSSNYLLITTMHWNSGFDIDFDEWKSVEQEYFDKVIDKNEYILGASVYRHMVSPDDSEVIFITVYDSLASLEKAIDVSNDLIETAWPNEDEREAFFNKQKSYYTGVHSDEIATSLPFQKDLITDSEDPLVIYVRKNDVGNGGGGYQEYFDNIIMKNFYIKGYYTYKHRFGANSTDATEIAIFESLADFEAAFVESDRLFHEYWNNEEERKSFLKEFRKIFSGHGDSLYHNIPGLAK